MTISHRNTKAEILAAFAEQTAALQAGPTWTQVAGKIAATAKCVSREIVLLGLDLAHGWRVAQVCYHHAVSEFSRPILKP